MVSWPLLPHPLHLHLLLRLLFLPRCQTAVCGCQTAVLQWFPNKEKRQLMLEQRMGNTVERKT